MKNGCKNGKSCKDSKKLGSKNEKDGEKCDEKSSKIEIVYSIDELDKVVEELYALKDKVAVYTFSGDLGAGKTTLIKALLKRFGVEELVTSPTFSYVLNYKNSKNTKNQEFYNFYHFDLYRIGSLNEFMDLGFDELIYKQNSWAFIEWPDVIMPLLNNSKSKVCNVNIDFLEDQRRLISF